MTGKHQPAGASNQPAPGASPAAQSATHDTLPAHASSHLLSTSVSRLNRLRAGVLGCNDGITSTAGLVVGVAASHPSTIVLAVTGLSGLLAGSLSMGGGEFTSVQAARDSQDALLRIQRGELETIPHEELDELAHLYMQRGLSLSLARQVAAELTEHDALAAHAHAELGIDLDDQVNPWDAAATSALSFLLGGVLSLLAILIPAAGIRIQVCVAVVLTSLAGTGYFAARFGSAPTGRAALRNLTVGSVTMAVTYALGALTQTLL